MKFTVSLFPIPYYREYQLADLSVNNTATIYCQIGEYTSMFTRVSLAMNECRICRPVSFRRNIVDCTEQSKE
jgi:hypothetical protein